MSPTTNVLEDIYFKTLEASPDAILVINDDGRIVVFNQQAEFMFGYSRMEVIDKSVEVLIPEELRDRHVKHLRIYMDEPRIREMGSSGMSLQGLHRTGRKFTIQIKLSPMIIVKLGLHVMAVIRKILDRSI